MQRLIIKREALYKAIWKEPIYKICQKYNLSKRKLDQICEYLQVPKPSKGYWRQYNAGKNPKIKELPTYNGTDEWIEYVSDYKKIREEELKKDSLIGYPKQEREKIRQACKDIDLNAKITKFHTLVLNRKPTIDTFYEIKESKEIKARINKIYHIIFSKLEQLGYRVEEVNKKYIVHIKGEEITFGIREKAKIQYRDPMKEDQYNISYVKGAPKIKELVGSGNLELKIDYYGKKAKWIDTPKTKLEEKIGDIIIELFYCAMNKKERRREREEEHKKYKEAERQKAERRILLRPQELKRIFQIGKKVSKITLGISGSNMRVNIIEDIIEKMVLHIGSFIKITVDCDMKELDISILATIARNIMECANTYFYYAERHISEEEIYFRYCIANLHYDNNMIDLIHKLGYPEDNFRTTNLYFGKKISIEEIKKNPIYKELSKIEKSQVLNGNQAYINKRQKDVHKILERNLESAVYNIFSNSAHSYYIGLGTNSINGSIAHISYITPEMLICLATEISIIYTANVLVDYLQLRKTLNQYLVEEEKIFLKSMTSIDKLKEWLQNQKEEYQDSFFDMKWMQEEEDIIL